MTSYFRCNTAYDTHRNHIGDYRTPSPEDYSVEMNGSMSEGMKALKKKVKQRYELNPKTELHLIYTVGEDGQKMGAPRVEFHQREPLVVMPEQNGDVNGGLEIMGAPPPRSPSPRPMSHTRPMSPPKTSMSQRPRSPMRASSPIGKRNVQFPGGRRMSFSPLSEMKGEEDRAASAVLTGAVTPLGLEDAKYVPFQGVNASEMDYQMPLPSIRPMESPPMTLNEPSYSTRLMPMDQGPPAQDYYQSWVHNARPPSTDRRINMSYPVSAPSGHFGRAGSTWRHVRQVTGMMGNNIMFIDGTVKSEDVQRFPPWGYKTEQQTVYNQPTYYSTMTGLPKRQMYPGGYENQYHERAKNGHKYWHDQKKVHSPMPRAKMTIQGRAMKYGIGM